ncbi:MULTISPECIES: AzlD domain-containing protein [Xenorhabdus]|uniref:Branched-subunit amino acid transport protein n=1 Tax=Xenorhabdus ehlersii TaxID=290111 RepID=A0A2D0IKA9_9GAMM|nr:MULTISPECIES: AzlD domain-containing protein [Xenorhabdus]MBC8951225.1 hypothetical protein [Xenorhabdus sp. TS4]PHM22210.1 hypothetical protein Xehl_03856 [Xenorhabdus ehlersii]RKE93048.1 branched-subunit amino acid transport protein [Xenorhabdus ehlersii]
MSHTMMVILAMGVTVFAVRSIAFIFANYITLPPIIKDAFELLPPAILTVIIANGVMIDTQTAALNLSLGNTFMLATLITVIIATRMKNFFGVILVGYLVFLALRALMGS